MIKIWLQHKILEYCIDIVFKGIFMNFIFPQIVPTMYVNFEDGIITISDNKNEISRNAKYKPSHKQLYVGEVVDVVMEFLQKYHHSAYDKISNAVVVTGSFDDTDFCETYDI